mmetsp:Transcript_14692/g.17884  ORF Transcript_14692/g.17884 Transcript_14692/m.17884 type:complete len:419 (+) Transcript_14692:293-1549(+)
MELRKLEHEISQLSMLYKVTSRRPIIHNSNHEGIASISKLLDWKELRDAVGKQHHSTSPNGKGNAIDNDNNEDEHDSSSSSSSSSNDNENLHFISANELLSTLQSLKLDIEKIQKSIQKFRERLHMKDPVTGANRYGDKTLNRVVQLLDTYELLSFGIDYAFGLKLQPSPSSSTLPLPSPSSSSQQDNSNMNCSTCDNTTSLVDILQQSIQTEEEYKQKRKEDEKATELRLEAQRKQEDEALQQELKRKEEEQILKEQQEREELSRRAEEARTQRIENELSALAQEQEVDRSLLASVEVGINGVKAQIEILKENCEKEEANVALRALHTIFSQIYSKPEEINFRRIRRDHPRFMDNIGKHQGGVQFFLAVGWRFVEIDGVKCIFSKEPDLETEMDQWSNWYDSIKDTIQVLNEEISKL